MKKNITAVSAVPERTIGIDLSDGTFRYCALNREGKIVDEGQRKLDRSCKSRLCFESWGFIKINRAATSRSGRHPGFHPDS